MASTSKPGWILDRFAKRRRAGDSARGTSFGSHSLHHGASGSYWWLVAWGLVFGFMLATIWIYPTLLAPLFNKFSRLEDGLLLRDSRFNCEGWI